MKSALQLKLIEIESNLPYDKDIVLIFAISRQMLTLFAVMIFKAQFQEIKCS